MTGEVTEAQIEEFATQVRHPTFNPWITADNRKVQALKTAAIPKKTTPAALRG